MGRSSMWYGYSHVSVGVRRVVRGEGLRSVEVWRWRFVQEMTRSCLHGDESQNQRCCE